MSSHILTRCPAYCVQLWCRDVREDNGIRKDYAATVICGELGVAHSHDVQAVMKTNTNTLSMIKPEESAAVLRRVANAVLTCRSISCSSSGYALRSALSGRTRQNKHYIARQGTRQDWSPTSVLQVSNG